MSNFDDLLQGQEQEKKSKEKSAEQARKSYFIGLYVERRNSCYGMIDRASKEVVGTAENMRKFLSVMSRFEAYSLNNNFLIYMQKPDATKLKERKAWEKDFPNKKRFIRKGGKSLMILEPQKYKGGDDKELVGYNPKLMFDVSDIVNAVPEPKISHDKVQLIRALVDHCSVPIVTLKEGYPPDAPLGAYYDAGSKRIIAKGGMVPEEIFQSVATAIAHAEMDSAERKTAERNQTTQAPYRTVDHEFQARCVAEALCMKYGVSTDRVEINSVPPKYAGMEADDIRHDLGAIHASVKAIKQRMEMILNPPSKEQTRKEQNQEAR